MDELDGRIYDDATRQVVTGDRGGLGEPPRDAADHRAQPHSLLDHRLEELLVAVIRGALHLREQIGAAREVVEDPGERRRSGLVAGEQQGDEVVAQLVVGLLRVRDEQLGQHVAPFVEVGNRAPVGDLGVHQFVDVVLQALEPPPRADALQGGIHPPDEDHRVDADQPAEQRAHLTEASCVGDAEDDAQDHLEADVVQVLMNRERHAERPGGDVIGSDLLHGAGPVAHRLPVKGGHHLASALAMRVLIEQQDGLLTHDRPEDRVSLAGMEGVSRAGEDLADVFRTGEHDAATGRRRVHGEHVPVATLPARRDVWPQAEEQDGLHRRRQFRARRQVERGRDLVGPDVAFDRGHDWAFRRSSMYTPGGAVAAGPINRWSPTWPRGGVGRPGYIADARQADPPSAEGAVTRLQAVGALLLAQRPSEISRTAGRTSAR